MAPPKVVNVPPVKLRLPFPELAPNIPLNSSNPILNGAPVIFSAQGSLAAGKSMVLNAQTLQSGFRTPYFIDEIRISAVSERVTDEDVLLTGLANLVRLKFQTGVYAFSKDNMPMGLYAPNFSTVDYGKVNSGLNGVDETWRFYSSVRWMLPKPLFMNAGDAVLANVELNDDDGILAGVFGTDAAVTITVTYVGRLLGQGFRATERCVPWVAWWEKRMSESVKSAQTRLRNPFMVSAHVQRFTQRSFFLRPDVYVITEEQSYGQFVDDTSPLPYEQIRIDDSRGYAIVSQYTPIGDVFDSTRHAWTFGRELTSREQFNMLMSTTNLSNAPVGTEVITQIGLVGYREEAP